MKFVISGVVLPERANVSHSILRGNLGDGSKFTFSCDASIWTITLDSTTIDGYVAALIIAKDLARTIISTLGFQLGCGYTVEARQVTLEDGTSVVFGVQPLDEHGASLRVTQAEVDGDVIRTLMSKNTQFRMAVFDYLAAMVEVSECGFLCYRAIESICKAVSIDQQLSNDAKSSKWELMHRVLGTQRDEIDQIVKDFATPVRHGDWQTQKPSTSVQRLNMLRLTRDVLVRYAKFSKKTA